jgi:PAS domain S-box-containing protein
MEFVGAGCTRLTGFHPDELVFNYRGPYEPITHPDDRGAVRRDRSLFEHATGDSFQTSPAGRYLEATPALARIYGFESPAAIMEGLRDIQHQPYDDPTRRQSFIRQMQEAGGARDFESRVHRRDGSVIWISENARVVAEGVETAEHLAFLREHDCDEGQGYLFSRPVPAAAIEPLLRAMANGVDDMLGRAWTPPPPTSLPRPP